ncbi:hypothetical protein ABPG72_006824 [Tetrahymena utriculariae]
MDQIKDSQILPSQFNQSAQFKEFEARCTERVLQYLTQPSQFQDQQQQNQDDLDNLVEQFQLNIEELKYQTAGPQQKEQEQQINNFDDQMNSVVKPIECNIEKMQSIDKNSKPSQKLDKIPTFSQKDDEIFQEETAGVDKKYSQFFHNSLQVSEDSCYQILQDNQERCQDDEKESQGNLLAIGNLNDQMKNYELSSIQQNTQNSLTNFNPNDDVLLTSNRDIGNQQGFSSELNNLMHLNLNLLFPNSQVDSESQKSSVRKQFENQNFFQSSGNTVSDHEGDVKKETLTAKELYLKAKEQNRIFLENLQKQSMRINCDELLLGENPFKESKLLENELKEINQIRNQEQQEEVHRQLNQVSIKTPELANNHLNNGEKTCINTLITECGEQGDLFFDLNELDSSIDNENFYEMIQQNINKVKEQTNFPNFNATFYPLDTINPDQEKSRGEQMDDIFVQIDQHQSNSSNQIQQTNNSSHWNTKNASYSSGNQNHQSINNQLCKQQKNQTGQKKQGQIKKKSIKQYQNVVPQQVPSNNAASLINKYYNKKNRSSSQQVQQSSNYNQNFNHLSQQIRNSSSAVCDKENYICKETLQQQYLKENEQDLVIMNQDPRIEILQVKAEQMPLKCISSNIQNSITKDTCKENLIKQQINQFKNILGSKSGVQNQNVSNFNSRKNSNVSSVSSHNIISSHQGMSSVTSKHGVPQISSQNGVSLINSQNGRQEKNKMNGVSVSKYNNNTSHSHQQTNLNILTKSIAQLKQANKQQKQIFENQENQQKNQQKKVTKNAAFEALQKIKNARSQQLQQGANKEDIQHFSQKRKRAQSITGDYSKSHNTNSSIDQKIESKLNTEATCSSSYCNTDQGSEFKRINKRQSVQASQICQSLEDLPSAKAKEITSDQYLRSSLNQVRNSFNDCLNSSVAKMLNNPRKISIYEDQHLMDAKKQEIEALQNLINSYEQEEQKFNSKLNEMNVNNIVIGDKKFIQQVRKSREERKQSTSNVLGIPTNASFTSRNKSMSINQQLEATFSNQQQRQSHSTQHNDFNQVHRLSGSFTTKSSRNNDKSLQQNSFSIDSRVTSNNQSQNQSMNSQVQQQPWFMKKAPFYVKQQHNQQINNHQVSQDATQNVAPSNTARLYINRSQNEIENKSHLTSQCEVVSHSPNPKEQINGIIQDLISDKVYLQAVALFTSCYYYSKQGSQPQNNQTGVGTSFEQKDTPTI